MILGIETSCDETSAAVVSDGRVRSNVVSSQAELHARFGGVVPEVASRRHLELVAYVVRDALAAGAPGAVPVIDARRREVFALLDEPRCLRPEELELAPGTRCVGDGAVRYRAVLEAAGAEVPPAESELHVPRAHLHAALARDFGPAEAVEPIYLRVPDAERAAAR